MVVEAGGGPQDVHGSTLFRVHREFCAGDPVCSRAVHEEADQEQPLTPAQEEL